MVVTWEPGLLHPKPTAVVLEHVLLGSENTITAKQGRVDVDPQHPAGCDEGLLIQLPVRNAVG